MTESVSWIRAMDPRDTKLNILLFAIPVTIYFNYVVGDYSMAFFFSLVAIMPLAFLMGRATEEIALRTSESLGGLLNATFGNAAELIIAVLLILEASKVADPETQSFFVHLVQASLIGSILGNLLLVMGLAFVWGGIHHDRAELLRDPGKLQWLPTTSLDDCTGNPNRIPFYGWRGGRGLQSRGS